MIKMIVTGSEGFIGKSLCRELRRRGVEVVEIDRKCGKEADELEKYIQDVSCVFHLAAQTSVFNTDNEQILKDNISAFMHVCDVCRENKIKLVYASSSTANACNTTSMYGISKYFDEQYASIYCPGSTGVRLHNVYGPEPRKGTLLWCLLNKEVQLYNSGENIRCFTYIDDAVEGLIFASGTTRQLVNVVNEKPITVKKFVSIAEKYKKLKYTLTPSKREHDNFNQNVNDSLFLVPLDYISVERGLEMALR